MDCASPSNKDLIYNTVLIPRHAAIYGTPKDIAHNQRFWDIYMAAGGATFLNEYLMHAGDETSLSHMHAMPETLVDWCRTLSSRILPMYKICKCKLDLIASTRSWSRGHLFYACHSCSNFFKFWASDYWAKMFRKFLDSTTPPPEAIVQPSAT